MVLLSNWFTERPLKRGTFKCDILVYSNLFWTHHVVKNISAEINLPKIFEYTCRYMLLYYFDHRSVPLVIKTWIINSIVYCIFVSIRKIAQIEINNILSFWLIPFGFLINLKKMFHGYRCQGSILIQKVNSFF